MSTVDVYIARKRAEVKRAEAEGRVQERDIAEAELRGALAVDAAYGGEPVGATCPHLVHDPVWDSSTDTTTWVCRACGEAST